VTSQCKNIGGEIIVNMIVVRAQTIPETYENLICRVDSFGKAIGDTALDAVSLAYVAQPFAEPRIHKGFPGGIEDLEMYTQEVIHGIHDHWINSSPTAWEYTYHQRLYSWKGFPLTGAGGLNQMQPLIEHLLRQPQTRQAQAITWEPFGDCLSESPPCLQRLWFRIIDNKLNMHACWRSRDLMGAWFMNAYAITELQKVIATQLSDKAKREIRVGNYIEFCDSLHVYNKDYGRFKHEVEKMRDRPIDERVYRTDNSTVQQIITETREKLAQNPDYMRQV